VNYFGVKKSDLIPVLSVILCRCFYVIELIQADRNKGMKDGEKITSSHSVV